ncbi:hypothetical protein ACSSS7_005408 [Eimeria intestinalis]
MTKVFRQWRQRRPRWLKAAWLIAVYAYGLALMHLFCRSAVIPTAREGAVVRRLAGAGGHDEDDLIPPSTPELVELCLGIEQDFALEEPLSGIQASSPLLKQSFLDFLEKDEEPGADHLTELFHPILEENQVHPVASFSMNRLSSEGTKDGDEVAGPSSKVPRREASSEDGPPAFPPPTLDQLSEASAPQQFASASLGPYASQPSSSSNLDLEAWFASSALAQKPSDPASGEHRMHPFVRIPPLQPGVTPRPFRDHLPPSPLMDARFPRLMRGIRIMLLKPSLSQADADELVRLSESLVDFARQQMTDTVSSLGVSMAINCLGRRFLLFSMLYMASQTLRQSWPSATWWSELAAIVTHDFPYSQKQEASMNPERRALAKKLISAIRLYKSGIAPSIKTIIDLKRSLFCSSFTSPRFKESKWQDWRFDDASYSEDT